MTTCTLTDSTLTLDKIRNRVYFFAKETKASTLFPCSEVTDVVNMALGKVWGALNHSYIVAYRNTSCGCAGYALPEARLVNGNAQVDEVWLDDEELSAVEYTERQDVGCLIDCFEKPESYWVSGNVVYLTPVPDGCYQLKVRYRNEFRKLSACSDIPNMTDLQIDAATFYAVHILKAKDEEFASSDYFKRMYDETMAEVMLIPPGLYKAAELSFGGAA